MQYEINLNNEQLIPIADVPSYLPRRRGKRTHYQTVYRWAMKGTKRAQLATIKVGGIRYTSLEALNRFAAAYGTVVQSDSYHDAVEQELNRSGL